MGIEDWLDHLSESEQETSSAPSLDRFDDDDKENCRPVHPFTRSYKRKRRDCRKMTDDEETPRPSKMQSRHSNPATTKPFLPRPASSSSASAGSCDSIVSHQSGRASPTKQMAILQDAEEPVLFYDFDWSETDLAEDVQALRDGIQPLADNRGILGHTKKELAHYASRKSPLNPTQRRRFAYPEAHDPEYPQKLGSVVPMESVQDLVKTAMSCEANRAHEFTWNEQVHYKVMHQAVSSSRQAQSLEICSLKSASVDPKDLIPDNLSLPRRVIDYAFVLRPDGKIATAWSKLQPLPGAHVKSWNNVTMNEARDRPIAINIETKAPNKSWTDGKPQLAIWISSLITRLRKLPDYRSLRPRVSDELVIPAMPIVIAQGHEWHLLIVSQVKDGSERRTLVWQMLGIGSTRTCFDTYKVIAVLHYLMGWAEQTWRPWFHSVIT